MKASELLEFDDDELDTRLLEAKQELFNLRFQLATGQLDNVARVGEVRRDIARLKTVIREREIDAAEAIEAAELGIELRPSRSRRPPMKAPEPARTPRRKGAARAEELEEAELEGEAEELEAESLDEPEEWSEELAEDQLAEEELEDDELAEEELEDDELAEEELEEADAVEDDDAGRER